MATPETRSTRQLLELSRNYSHALLIQSNNIKAACNLGPERTLMALGCEQELVLEGETGSSRVGELLEFLQKTQGQWRFGYLGYGLRTSLEQLPDRHTDKFETPAAHWWIPELVFEQQENGWVLRKGDISALQQVTRPVTQAEPQVNWQARTDRETYIRDVLALKEHIRLGNIYEINYCMEFYAEQAVFDPVSVYEKLNAFSPMPFSAYLKTGNLYALCASPERFLLKKGSRLWSQPIKGTIRRGQDPLEDDALKTKLRADLKEQAENIMIVDLVRNDLARNAVPGTVKVDELFGIYTFKRLHQMISTVSCELAAPDGFQAMLDAFPMGSMTGAPKIRAMELIDEFEKTARGLYSGAMGYISPDGDFDLNVVIRTLMYRKDLQLLGYQAGSAITYTCDPEKEYEECLLKANSMRAVFGA